MPYIILGYRGEIQTFLIALLIISDYWNEKPLFHGGNEKKPNCRESNLCSISRWESKSLFRKHEIDSDSQLQFIQILTTHGLLNVARVYTGSQKIMKSEAQIILRRTWELTTSWRGLN